MTTDARKSTVVDAGSALGFENSTHLDGSAKGKKKQEQGVSDAGTAAVAVKVSVCVCVFTTLYR